MAKKKVSTTSKRSVTRNPAKSGSIMMNQFFGMLLIAVGVGALIVFLRYLVITWVAPADVYLIEPSQLIPGAQ